MENKKLLLVEDEPFLAKVIEDSLKQKGYQVTYANDGKRGYNLFLNGNFEIIPILFLTAKTETTDLVIGYESGGNDYLKKPFSLEELFLRVDQLLRRNLIQSDSNLTTLAIGNYLFSHHKQELSFNNETIKLSSREAELLLLLYKNKNQLTDRKLALLSLWGDDSFFNTRTMDVFITRLRKHLKKDNQIEILNVRGMGYKLIC